MEIENAVTRTQAGVPSVNLRGWLSTVTGGAIGNLIEWYDWTIYGFLAGIFSLQIFPAHNAATSLIAAFTTFAVGFLMRPVGSIILSPLGDKYGRRRVLSLTIIMMGVGSLMVALTPTYASIGIGAPIIFLIARLLQGLSAGGEFQGATVFLVEHAPPNRRGFVGSSQLVSIGLSIFVATGVAALTTALIPQPALGAWGWRVPFLLGALLSLYGIYLRLGIPETPSFIGIEKRHEIAKRPLLEALSKHPLESLRVVAVQITTVPFYLWTVFLPTYAHLSSGLPLREGFVGSMIALAVFTALLPFIGLWSDRFVGRKPMLLGSAIGFIVLAYPLFRLLQHANFGTFLFVDVVGCLLLVMVDGVMPAVLCEQFPTQLRTCGIGLPYALTTAIFGGTAPLVATWFIAHRQPLGIAIYVIVVCAAAAIVYAFMPETRAQVLDAAAR